MKIGIDISLTIGEKGGVGIYSYHLVKELSKIDYANEYILYPFFYHIFHPDYKKVFRLENPNFKIHMNDVPKDVIKEMWFNPGQSRKELLGNVDVLHSTTFCAPSDHNGKLVVTIYDLSFITHPECHIEENRIHCLSGSLDAALYADKIIAISNHTKQDIINYLNIPEDRIAVTHLSAGEQFRPVKDHFSIKKVLKKYQISRKYIFSLGSLEPRKNIKSLIEAYLMLPEIIKNEYNLVIGGGTGWLNADIKDKIEKLSMENNIMFIGFVEEDDLPVLYSAAELFAYPSLYEGFGLPVLEAMACGVPVITSDNSSLKEIAEGIGILVDPLNVIDIRDAIVNILKSPQRKEELIEKGLKRAADFSWTRTASETLKVYEDVCKN